MLKQIWPVIFIDSDFGLRWPRINAPAIDPRLELNGYRIGRITNPCSLKIGTVGCACPLWVPRGSSARCRWPGWSIRGVRASCQLAFLAPSQRLANTMKVGVVCRRRRTAEIHADAGLLHQQGLRLREGEGRGDEEWLAHPPRRLRHALLRQIRRRTLRERRGLWPPPGVAGLRPQPETVHDAAGVIGIVAHSELRLDRIGKACGGPAISIQARHPGPGLIHFGNRPELFRAEAAGTARRAPFAERLDASSIQGAMPPGCGGAAHPEFSGDVRLFQSSLQVLCG